MLIGPTRRSNLTLSSFSEHFTRQGKRFRCLVLCFVRSRSRRRLRCFLGQPPAPELMMLAFVRLLYGQEPPDTLSSEPSLSASAAGEIWDAAVWALPLRLSPGTASAVEFVSC